MTGQPSPVEEYTSDRTAFWMSIRNYWRDRKQLLSNPAVSTDAHAQTQLKNSPLGFASQSLLFVPILLTLIQPAVDFLVALPALPEDAELTQVEAMAKWAKQALANKNAWPALPTDAPFDVGLLVSQPRASVSEGVLADYKNRLDAEVRPRKAAARASAAYKAISPALTGAGLLLSAYLFRAFLRRMRPQPKRVSMAARCHLYYISARFFWPMAVISFGIYAVDVGVRIAQDDTLYFLVVWLFSIVGIWALLILRSCRSALAAAMPQPDDGTASTFSWGNQLLNRLMLSNILTTLTIFSVLFLVVRFLLSVALRIPQR